jgi:hypothetical protein
MVQKKLGEYATPNDDYLGAPITQPVVTTENYVRNNHLYPCLKPDMSQVIDEISLSPCY